MSQYLPNMLILPILIPLLTGTCLLVVGDKYRSFKWWLSLVVSISLVILSSFFVYQGLLTPNKVISYHLGSLPSPISINLIADLLSSFFLLITSIILLCAILFAFAHWHNEGSYFYSLVLFLTLGLNGCYLTGDIFNLFVFFEITLGASYGLALYGMTIVRLKIILHYLIINLLISSFFLISIAIIYGSLGTLNIAHIFANFSSLDMNEFTLAKIGIILLGLTFLVKIGMWPLGFWMPATYATLISPVAAMFLVLSKVSLYVILRYVALIQENCSLLFNGWELTFMFWGGLFTSIYGMILALSHKSMSYITASGAIISSGLTLMVIGYEPSQLLAGLLYYVATATFSLVGLFLLSELVSRCLKNKPYVQINDIALKDDNINDTPLSKSIIFIGISFIFFITSFVGIPPFAKLSLLTEMVDKLSRENILVVFDLNSWLLIITIFLSSFIYFISFLRFGTKVFWNITTHKIITVKAIEVLSIVLLAMLLFAMTIFVNPLWKYLDNIELQYSQPQIYMETIAHTIITPNAEISPREKPTINNETTINNGITIEPTIPTEPKIQPELKDIPTPTSSAKRKAKLTEIAAKI